MGQAGTHEKRTMKKNLAKEARTKNFTKKNESKGQMRSGQKNQQRLL